MWGGTVTRQQLRETISRLRRLKEVPEMPRENNLVPRVNSMHHLTISREKEIVGNLAFLLATSDDSLKVMAVCIEEQRNGQGSIFRIASNTGDLLEVTHGFTVLAKILERAARRKNPKSKDVEALLRQVVILDFYRILSRLRSRHANRTRKTAGKQAIIAQLNEAIQDKSVKPRSGFTKSDLKAVRNGARDLQVLFTRLESIPNINIEVIEAQEAIEEIVKQAHEFTQAINLGTALRGSMLDPSLKTHLPEAISKLGRYYSVASELICAARDRECRIFENIQVEPFQVDIPAPLQEQPWKVHAEIQLLFFYEIHPDYPRPRIICSSKSACYLCNLFFHIHAGFYVPRTHGRLYEKWILPDWLDIPTERHEELGRVLTRLKASLDDKIQSALNSNKRQYNHPNESILLPLAHWPSTSAISGNLSSLASTPTVRPRSSLIQAENPSRALSVCTELPLTPPKTPPDLPHATNSDIKTEADLGTTSLVENSTDHMQTSDAVSLINIGHRELPFSQSITLATPSLHLQLDKLSLTLDFVHVRSGRFSITQLEDAALCQEAYRVVNIEDILPASELQLNCSNGSSELTVQLRNDQKGIISIGFVWG